MALVVFSISSNIRALERQLDTLQRKQIPFAASQAVNRVARQAVIDLQDAMTKNFDRPTPYTLRAFYAHGGMKHNPTAEILAKDGFGKGTPGWKYLTPEIFGGERRMKRFERALQATIGGEGFAVPGRGARLNQYGNISQGDIEKILSALGAAEQTSGYLANRTARSARRKGRKLETYFIAHSHVDGRLLGIYKVMGAGHVEPVLIFPQRTPSYRARLPYSATIAMSVEKNVETFLAEEFKKALWTAKPPSA